MARKAKDLAEVLMKRYTDGKTHFLLPEHEFKAMSGKGKMGTKYLASVDASLRKSGYVLIDLHKEMHLIGVLRIEEIAQWDIPQMHDDIAEGDQSEKDVPQEDQVKEDEKLLRYGYVLLPRHDEDLLGSIQSSLHVSAFVDG